MPAILPGVAAVTQQAEVSFVNKRGWLESLVGRLRGELGGSQFAQFFVNEREQLLGRLGIPCSMAFRMMVTSLMVCPLLRRRRFRPRPPRASTSARRCARRPKASLLQGGNSLIINHHYGLQSQRYAIDIFKVAENMGELKQWQICDGDASFGQTVCSPCDGRVAYVEDDHPDNAKGETDWEHPAGNYLTIEIATNRYAMLAHLKQKSLLVTPGEKVHSGQRLALCGNSGNTSGPHVHMQIQTEPQFNFTEQAVPMCFQNLLRGNALMENRQPMRNDLLILTGD